MISKRWIAQDSKGRVALDDETLDAARRFVFAQWKRRAAERGLPEPEDLSNACKFSSLFVKLVFGGSVRGNTLHQFNVVNGEIVDLNDRAADVLAMQDPYLHDEIFCGNREHLESLRSCPPRLEAWVPKFIARLEDEFTFMNGGCHALAVEISRLAGKDMAVVTVGDDVAHVMVRMNASEFLDRDSFLDIKGIRSLREILAEADVEMSDTHLWDVFDVDARALGDLVGEGRLEPMARYTTRAQEIAAVIVEEAGLSQARIFQAKLDGPAVRQ